ncbi:MAG: hypothetical protein KJO65_09560 [Gemmatimonadetes bacterium]|nr:hypothetical protein [Gemmatimonadota bacterium]
MKAPEDPPVGSDVGAVVRTAIQDLVAQRLGRGFVPLVGLFSAGLLGLFSSRPAAVPVAVGAVASAACMLAYGLAIVDSTSGRLAGVRGILVLGCSAVPPLYGVFIVGWPGLRGFAAGDGVIEVTVATLYVLLGVWVLRSWLRVAEVRRLARAMVSPHDVPGDSA